MNNEKSQLLKSGEIVAINAEEKHERMGIYKFLGFQYYWGKSRNGRWRLKYKSRADRFTATLERLKEYLRENLNTRESGSILERMVLKVKGWLNYHAISDNERRVKSFLFKTRRIIYTWYNRRGKKRSMTWEHLLEILDRVGFPKSVKVVSMFC